MVGSTSKATLSKGRSGWCVIFRHPVARTADNRDKLRVRRGLGTRDEVEAAAIINQVNEILAAPEWWVPSARLRAEARFTSKLAVAAFYDYLAPESTDAWVAREKAIPLPGQRDGFARLLMIGTTGAGKTTVVRQLIDTDPVHERFPSTSAAKTTICDIEIVLRPGPFEAAVAFTPKDQVRQFIADCVAAAATSHLQRADRAEVARKFLEHTDQQFRLSYVLGMPTQFVGSSGDLFDDDEADSPVDTEDALLTAEERATNSERIQSYLDSIEAIAMAVGGVVEKQLGSSFAIMPAKDRDAFEELAEEELTRHEAFHELVDEILDDVESRFDHLEHGTLERSRDDWPRLWRWTSDGRTVFIREINRFSSNYAPSFGRLITPLVEGIRVAGPFRPDWAGSEPAPLVIMDGKGIGHTADSASSVSTSITRRYEIADAILLVDNAAQPMQAAPTAVLRSLVASGHESKLILCFTHFDEVKGDNLLDTAAKKNHVLGSVDSAFNAVGKSLGREAEHSLRRLIPERAIFLSSIHRRLSTGARFTLSELHRIATLAAASIEPMPPTEYRPMYDVANLVLQIQRATQEFHDEWSARLGMGSRSVRKPDHWARVKALTRYIGLLGKDEYDTLTPVADLIAVLQVSISQYLAVPFDWSPTAPPESDIDSRLQVIDQIKKAAFQRLHELSPRRLLVEQLTAWRSAFDHRGYGSTRVRAREVLSVYELAAPVPNEMPDKEANDFLFEIRELVAESIEAGGGEIRGWTRAGATKTPG